LELEEVRKLGEQLGERLGERLGGWLALREMLVEVGEKQLEKPEAVTEDWGEDSRTVCTLTAPQ
jgi:hypothetical protein